MVLTLFATFLIYHSQEINCSTNTSLPLIVSIITNENMLQNKNKHEMNNTERLNKQ